MTWNHRIIRQKAPEGEYFYQIHEVHYDKDMYPTVWSTDSASVSGDSVNDVLWSYNKIKKAFNKPVLEVVGGKLEEVE